MICSKLVGIFLPPPFPSALEQCAVLKLRRSTDLIMCLFSFLQIIPLAQSEIDSMVATFRMLSDEVRRNIPDILLATMNILFTKHKDR